MIAVAAVADGATIQSAPEFMGNYGFRSTLSIFGHATDLDLTLPLQKLA